MIVGDTLVAIGFYLFFRVYSEKTFSSAIINVVEGQRVVSTGPYALVRHPMYASASLYLAGTPLALSSWWGFVPFAFMMAFLPIKILQVFRPFVRVSIKWRPRQVYAEHFLLSGAALGAWSCAGTDAATVGKKCVALNRPATLHAMGFDS